MFEVIRTLTEGVNEAIVFVVVTVLAAPLGVAAYKLVQLWEKWGE